MSQSVIETVQASGITKEEPGQRSRALWLHRAIVALLFMFALCAPHSIAATQIAWGCALFLWAVSFAVRPRPKVYRTPLDYALLGLFILTFISAIFSYDIIVSLGKLRAASLFTIVYLVAENVTSWRLLRLLALALVGSCMLNVVYTFGERIVGRGVKVEGLAAASPLRAAGIKDGDTLLEVDGRPLRSLDQLDRDLAAGGSVAAPAGVKIYRFEWVHVYDVPRGQELEGATGAARLGVGSWSHGRDWRATGFYSHYVTYAEALQLITSLAVGLLVALRRKRSWPGILLAVMIAGLSGALLLTVTRASWLSMLLSAFVIVLTGTASRRVAMILLVALLPVIFAGLLLLQQKRHVGFFDPSDGSITWRETVYREGVELLLKKPRHLLVGIGMDSIKSHWREWGMFDHGRLPIGHMHSTPLQLALERGIPAMLVWLALVGLYGRMLWHLARGRGYRVEGWIERGIVLGALGGLVGFFSSGLVHYNLGDSTVAMIFYFIMGLTLVVERLTRTGFPNGAARIGAPYAKHTSPSDIYPSVKSGLK